MNLQQVLDALKSCGIKTELFYGSHGGVQDSYYIKDGKYYHSYPDDFDRPRKIIEEEIESEEKFIQKLLYTIKQYIKDFSVYPSGLISVLSALCSKKGDNDLKTYHHTLFEWNNPLWNICQKMNYEDFWKFNIITQKGELFNQIYNYGIGFIDGKYIVEYQLPIAGGDRAGNWYYDWECDNYYDAFNRLKRCSEKDIYIRQRDIDEYIQNYVMNEPEKKLAQEMCNLLNDKSQNPYNKFAIHTADAINVVYIDDYGYYSYVVTERQVPQSIRFHCNGKDINSVIRSFCKDYNIKE